MNEQPQQRSAADEMAARILHTYRDIFSGADRTDPVEATAQRIAHTLRDTIPPTTKDE